MSAYSRVSYDLTDCFNNNEFQRCNSTYNESTWWIYNYGHCITNVTEAEMLGVNSTIAKSDRVSRELVLRCT